MSILMQNFCAARLSNSENSEMLYNSGQTIEGEWKHNSFTK